MSKIVELREKASNVNQWLTFKNRVMGLLSSVMTPDQRNAFLEALEADYGQVVTENPVETPENPLE
mgnify:FL=1